MEGLGHLQDGGTKVPQILHQGCPRSSGLCPPPRTLPATSLTMPLAVTHACPPLGTLVCVAPTRLSCWGQQAEASRSDSELIIS